MPKTEFKDANNNVTITLDADTGDIVAGGNQKKGEIRLKDEQGNEIVYISAFPQMVVRTPDGKQRFFLGLEGGTLHIGGNGSNGLITVHNANSALGILGQVPKATIRLDGQKSELSLRNDGKIRARIEGINADAWLGGNGADGNIMLFDSNGDNTTLAQATIHLNGQAGDIILKNADCAEEFDISEMEDVIAGTVMVLDAEGKLRQSREPYDKRVAGVISGAGEYRPGIVLDKKISQADRMPLALVGKVYCRADAQCSPIEVGDLLTTSATPGHAMKACDPLKAFGAVIGKALRPLKTGAGLIPILVALQ